MRACPRMCVRVRVGASVAAHENVLVPQHVCIRACTRVCVRWRVGADVRACAHVCARVRVFPHEHTCTHARGLAAFQYHGRESSHSVMLLAAGPFDTCASMELSRAVARHGHHICRHDLRNESRQSDQTVTSIVCNNAYLSKENFRHQSFPYRSELCIFL